MFSVGFGIIRGYKVERFKFFYLREKYSEFLMDFRLWLGGEIFRRRRCVVLIIILWSDILVKGLRVR